jgi:hypothetical protein
MTPCSCGGVRGRHVIGHSACFRVACSAPVMLGDGLWQVEGGTPMSTFTMLHTQLYRQHSDGTWSRPKRPVSQPPLSA